MKVSDFFTSFFSIQSSGLKSRTSPAIWQAKAVGSNFVIRPIPERPSMMPFHVGSLPVPRGEIMPMPVMTTRRLFTEGESQSWLGCLGAFLDVVDCVFDFADFLGLVVGDLNAELLLEGHDQLDLIERISAEVLDERSVRSDLVRVDPQLLDDD